MSKLYVDELHPKTSGSAVKRPNLPAWRLVAVHADRTSSDAYDVVWNTATDSATTNNRRFVLGGCTHESNGYDMTVPVEGIYQVNVTVRVDEIGSGYVAMNISVNGNTTFDTDTIDGTPASSYSPLSMADTMYLKAGDKLKVRVTSSADTSWEVDARSYFSGHLVG